MSRLRPPQGYHDPGAGPLSREAVPLFHPRRVGWAEHFRLHLDGRIEGRTPIGRATVVRPAMNRRTGYTSPSVVARHPFAWLSRKHGLPPASSRGVVRIGDCSTVVLGMLANGLRRK